MTIIPASEIATYEELKCCSFDIFDTLLVRTVNHPKDVFLLMQQRLGRQFPDLPENLITSFWGGRVWSEFIVRRRTKRQDVNLTDIYKELGNIYRLESGQISNLLDFELETEASLLFPVEGALAIVENARRDYGNVIFISEMYMPQSFVCRILSKYGLFQPGDKVYLSGEQGVTKGTGDLYRFVLRDLNLEPSQLLHFGDHRRLDVAVPRSIGMRTFPYPHSSSVRDLFFSWKFVSQVRYVLELLQARFRMRRFCV